MKHVIVALTVIVPLMGPKLVLAQATGLGVNNPNLPGIYVGGLIGVNFANDIDFDFDNPVFDDFSVEPNTGFLFGLAVGYNLPQDDLNFRVEGELNGRENGVDEVDFATTDDLDINNGEVQSIAGMVNAYADYYFVPDVAVTIGAGIGYANVTPDVVVISDESTSGFAYQVHLGGRYNIGLNTAVSLGYTYFTTTELEIDSAAGNEINFDYANHGFHVGAAYLF